MWRKYVRQIKHPTDLQIAVASWRRKRRRMILVAGGGGGGRGGAFGSPWKLGLMCNSHCCHCRPRRGSSGMNRRRGAISTDLDLTNSSWKEKERRKKSSRRKRRRRRRRRRKKAKVTIFAIHWIRRWLLPGMAGTHLLLLLINTLLEIVIEKFLSWSANLVGFWKRKRGGEGEGPFFFRAPRLGKKWFVRGVCFVSSEIISWCEVIFFFVCVCVMYSTTTTLPCHSLSLSLSLSLSFSGGLLLSHAPTYFCIWFFHIWVRSETAAAEARPVRSLCLLFPGDILISWDGGGCSKKRGRIPKTELVRVPLGQKLQVFVFVKRQTYRIGNSKYLYTQPTRVGCKMEAHCIRFCSCLALNCMLSRHLLTKFRPNLSPKS